MTQSSQTHRKLQTIRNYLLALGVLGSGLINLYSASGRALPARAAILRDIFPLVFIHLSRFFAMLTGFALVVLSINIYKRKKRAFQITLLLSILSILFYLTKGLDYEEATLSVILIVLLLLNRKAFTVGSGIPNLRWGFARLGVALMAALREE